MGRARPRKVFDNLCHINSGAECSALAGVQRGCQHECGTGVYCCRKSTELHDAAQEPQQTRWRCAERYAAQHASGEPACAGPECCACGTCNVNTPAASISSRSQNAPARPLLALE